MKLSARNRLQGTVQSINRGEAIANVVVDVSGQRVVASITVEAVDELGLAEGSRVSAVIKASDVMIDRRLISSYAGPPESMEGVKGRVGIVMVTEPNSFVDRVIHVLALDRVIHVHSTLAAASDELVAVWGPPPRVAPSRLG